ncbi:hypothetical protein [Caldimonas brevitalea]|uniref:Uncharacterized protein n=1 Tax=Caldimonas brevitalea TaxID=413882 RepID=A0A0G3BLJ6_9BURK|nr:hypothetical protein [Caldimonas brevitalea]AKJ27425.1 hypothetical protein AAW51_0734 [Caldimonas brevitalea]
MKTTWYSPPNARDLTYEIRHDDQTLAVFLNGSLVQTAYFETDGLAAAAPEAILDVGKQMVRERHPLPQPSRNWAPPPGLRDR